MEDDVSNPFRRMSMRTRKIAPKMTLALALIVEAVDDDETSLDDDVYIQKKQKGTKHKTRQAKALENARKASKNSLNANLKALPPHVPSYMRVVMGRPSSTCHRHFCIVCEFTSNYTCAKCGMHFCSN
ncbi:SWR1 complex [Salix suchowensis]|nr:SWR1 complex [Salix suchowensis]